MPERGLMRVTARRALAALLVVGAIVSISLEYAEAAAVPRFSLATVPPDPGGFLAEVRAGAPRGGVVAVSRDDAVLSAGWKYCSAHAQMQPGSSAVVAVGKRQLTDGAEIGIVARAALASLCP